MSAYIAATPFTDSFLNAVQPLAVRSLYGAPSDVGGFRGKKWLPPVDRDLFARHVARAREMGIGFYFTLNNPDMGNREFTGEWQRWIVDTLAWLEDAGVEGVIVANPYLVELVKRRSELKVEVSTLANVDSLSRLKFYEDLGADSVFPPEYMNRDFKTLAAMRREARCDLVLTVNLGCVMACSWRQYHMAVLSHSSEALDRGGYVDYPLINCTLLKASDPANVLKSSWVRPEDLSFYEEIGYDTFKISGRTQGEDWIVRAVAAYFGRSYRGPLNDVIDMAYDVIEPFTIFPYLIDNSALDGFMEEVKGKDCRWGCGNCRVCDVWAERAVSERAPAEAYCGSLRRAIDRVATGSFRGPSGRL